jgi:hypothetical protein
MFAIMPQSVRRGFVGLSRPKNSGGAGGYDDGHRNPLLTTANSSSSSIFRRPYTMLALNLLSQLICVAGVNQLSSVRAFFRGGFFLSLLPPTNLACFKKINIKPPISSPHSLPLPLSLFPIRQNGLVTPFFFFDLLPILLPIESVRGVNTGRTHDAQGNKLVFQRMVVRQWLECTARGGGRHGVRWIILVFSSASAGTSGAKQ